MAKQRAVIMVPAFAKINLCLCVGGRQADGYHAIDTIFHSLALHDDVHMEAALEFELTVDGPYATGVPLDDSNLAMKAAHLMGTPVRMRLTKRIPPGSGLGGGSADAAAVLTGLNHLLDKRLSDAELQAMAAKIGSDVPFALRGGTARGWGRGEQLAHIPAAARLSVVLVLPAFGVSTAWCYQEWSRTERRAEAPSCGPMAQALLARRLNDVYRGLHNDLERVAFTAHPALAEIKQRLLDAGCVAAAMTGSGSCVFGLAESPDQAYRIADTIRIEGQVVVTRSRDGREAS